MFIHWPRIIPLDPWLKTNRCSLTARCPQLDTEEDLQLSANKPCQISPQSGFLWVFSQLRIQTRHWTNFTRLEENYWRGHQQKAPVILEKYPPAVLCTVMLLAEQTAVTALQLRAEVLKLQSQTLFDVFSRSFRQHTLVTQPNINTSMQRLTHFHFSPVRQTRWSFLCFLWHSECLVSSDGLLAHFQELPMNFWTDVNDAWQEVPCTYQLPPKTHQLRNC